MNAWHEMIVKFGIPMWLIPDQYCLEVVKRTHMLLAFFMSLQTCLFNYYLHWDESNNFLCFRLAAGVVSLSPRLGPPPIALNILTSRILILWHYILIMCNYVSSHDIGLIKFAVAVALINGLEILSQWNGGHMWLNEGFATWVSYLAADQFFPEWNVWTQFLEESTIGFKLDALAGSHPIELKECNSLYEENEEVKNTEKQHCSHIKNEDWNLWSFF
ncbi:hypothetical protein ACJX0J_017678, partial [Zea mays]